MNTIAPQPMTAPARLSVANGGAPALRLTRRGRLTLVVLVAALAFVIVSLGQVAASARSASEPDAAVDTPVSSSWVVQPGETLWSIAERLGGETDPRETVARIVAMNDLPNSSVQAGQELQIPA